MPHLGKTLIITGLIITIIGIAISISGKIDWLGRLPGDINIRRDNVSFHFPITTCLILSALISLVLWLLRR